MQRERGSKIANKKPKRKKCHLCCQHRFDLFTTGREAWPLFIRDFVISFATSYSSIAWTRIKNHNINNYRNDNNTENQKKNPKKKNWNYNRPRHIPDKWHIDTVCTSIWVIDVIRYNIFRNRKNSDSALPERSTGHLRMVIIWQWNHFVHHCFLLCWYHLLVWNENHLNRM